jgi:hypothetical protein
MPTTEDIEMRVCRDEDRGNEDIQIQAIDLYVQQHTRSNHTDAYFKVYTITLGAIGKGASVEGENLGIMHISSYAWSCKLQEARGSVPVAKGDAFESLFTVSRLIPCIDWTRPIVR